MDEPPLELDLLAFAYLQAVLSRAKAAWEAGHGDDFLAVLAHTRGTCHVEPVSEDLVHRLLACCPDARTQYNVLVVLDASQLWQDDHWETLLTVLAGPATAAVAPLGRPAADRIRQVAHDPLRTRAAWPGNPSHRTDAGLCADEPDR